MTLCRIYYSAITHKTLAVISIIEYVEEILFEIFIREGISRFYIMSLPTDVTDITASFYYIHLNVYLVGRFNLLEMLWKNLKNNYILIWFISIIILIIKRNKFSLLKTIFLHNCYNEFVLFYYNFINFRNKFSLLLFKKNDRNL